MKHLVRNIILLVMAAALATGIAWARYKAGGERCTGVDIQIVNADSTRFVTPRGVLAELDKLGIKVEGKRMGDINASDIEEALTQSPYLENVDCVKAQNGRFVIRATQLVPVVRVFDGDESYYVNKAGKRMSATAFYHADVPVVQGHFTRNYPVTRLLPLVEYVESDTLLSSLVSMYSVTDTNNIIIVPDIYGHVVNMGNAEGFVNKFDKLKLFYREVMPNKGWLTYDTISVKWDHQVVATRRVKAVKTQMEYDPEDDEQLPDNTTMTVGDEHDATARKAAPAPAADDSKNKKKDKPKPEAEKQKPKPKQQQGN